MPKKVRRGFNFNIMEFKAPSYSRFNLSHDRLQTLQAGKLTPLWWTEMVPGDVFSVKYSGFMRLLALSSPMLQREDIFIRAFFVPFRILANQDDIDKLFAGSKNGEHYDTPFLSLTPEQMLVGSLYDHLELPLPYKYSAVNGRWELNQDADVSPEVSAFPFLAYQRIYHDHFRNEETEDDYLDCFKLHFEDIDGHDADLPISIDYGDVTYDKLQSVCWERTYLTSALASSQRGSQVSIPLVGTATGNVSIPYNQYSNGQDVYLSGSGSSGTDGKFMVVGTNQQDYDVTPSVTLDGSSFSGIGAIALRLAMNLQAFMERNNIAGYRMIGNTLAHFGVYSSNKLQDEAQYLGGIKAPITISAVTQTSATEAMSGLTSTPQGTQVGQGQASFSDVLFSNFRTEERGILMIVGYVNAKESTSQGLARKWTRRSYLDYYWPEFQTIGEQEILNQEVYHEFEQSKEHNDTTWAYQSRYSEYKYEPDTIGGDFRTSLSYWHQSRLFNSLPAFNDSFVKSNPSDRVFAVNTQTFPRPYLLESYFEVDTVRPMSKYAQSKLW